MNRMINPLTMEEDSNGIRTDSCLFEDQRGDDVHPLTDQQLDALLEERAMEVDDAQAILQYPKYLAHRFLLSPNQHGNGNRKPTHLVIHTIQGSYEGAISWFQQRRSYVSAHYLVSFEGHTTQMVAENKIAWHVGNHNGYTVGIEHEGYAHDGVDPTSKMFHASAKLAAGICWRWGIPINRDRIKGHREYRGQTHTDPGNEWDMDRYVNLVRQYAKQQAAPSPAPAPVDEPQKAERVYFIYHRNAMRHTKNAAKAAASALKEVGIAAQVNQGTNNANFAADKALNGKLGQFITIVQGSLALRLFAKNKRQKFTSDTGKWFHPDHSDVWDARTNVTEQTRWNISRLCKRAGVDEDKALKKFSEVYNWLQGKA